MFFPGPDHNTSDKADILGRTLYCARSGVCTYSVQRFPCAPSIYFFSEFDRSLGIGLKEYTFFSVVYPPNAAGEFSGSA